MVFPTSPIVGQVFTSGGRSWVWNGSTWDSPARDNPTIQGLVQVFANSAARTTAIPSPTEGMTTYQLDTNFIDTYSGTAWVPTVSNNAWTSYTPTITVASGAITSATTVGSFKLVGKVCHVKQSISIVNNGNAGGWIGLSLPFPAGGVGSSTGLYRENAATGAMGQILVGGTAIYFNSGNGYPGGNGFNLIGSFFYEVA
jgi:hypothetical protein